MKVSALLSLVPLAAALPGLRMSPNLKDNSNGAFGVTAAHSGSPIHFLPLTASGSYFWLGGHSETYCPGESVPNCYQQNNTILVGEHYLVRTITTSSQNYDANKGSGRHRPRWPIHLRRPQGRPQLYSPPLSLHAPRLLHRTFQVHPRPTVRHLDILRPRRLGLHGLPGAPAKRDCCLAPC